MEINQEKFLELTDKLAELEKDLKAKDELIEGLKQKGQELDQTINKQRDQIGILRDQNTDLFLRVTQPVEEATITVEEPKQEETITLDDILSNE